MVPVHTRGPELERRTKTQNLVSSLGEPNLSRPNVEASIQVSIFQASFSTSAAAASNTLSTLCERQQ